MKEQLRLCALGLLSLGLAASFSPSASAQMFDDDDVIEERDMIDRVPPAFDDDDEEDDVRVIYGGPVYRDGAQRCAETFRSFDPNAGTYVTYQGEVRVCPYL